MPKSTLTSRMASRNSSTGSHSTVPYAYLSSSTRRSLITASSSYDIESYPLSHSELQSTYSLRGRMYPNPSPYTRTSSSCSSILSTRPSTVRINSLPPAVVSRTSVCGTATYHQSPSTTTRPLSHSASIGYAGSLREFTTSPSKELIPPIYNGSTSPSRCSSCSSMGPSPLSTMRRATAPDVPIIPDRFLRPAISFPFDQSHTDSKPNTTTKNSSTIIAQGQAGGRRTRSVAGLGLGRQSTGSMAPVLPEIGCVSHELGRMLSLATLQGGAGDLHVYRGVKGLQVKKTRSKKGEGR
ncbi:MAG: hypothetical protein M1834_009433 [Cirrosporium novae-zelandiae]|nr:MAG: hypothetical protein M1834_009433 [Cirrosporium novae-zelandiae]